MHLATTPAHVRATTDLDRLGDEIAELSAHLDAATAHLLALIRELRARVSPELAAAAQDR